MSFLYPPIPAGERIFVSESDIICWPVPALEKTGDAHASTGWGWAIMALKPDLSNVYPVPGSYKTISNVDINFRSKLSKIFDPNASKDKVVFIDDMKIYTYEMINESYVLTERPRIDKFIGKNVFFSICPLTSSEITGQTEKLMDNPIITPTIKQRSFYCGSLVDSNNISIVLYDFLDDKFSLNLPFKPTSYYAFDVPILSRTTSYKENYIVFVTVETFPNNTYNVSLYAITEKNLVEKHNNLTINDFIAKHLPTSNEYPVNIFVDHFYSDEQNTGSDQFVLFFSNESGTTMSLQMFEINDAPEIVNTSSYSTTNANSLFNVPMYYKTRAVRYTMTRNGPVFIMVNQVHNNSIQKVFVFCYQIDVVSVDAKNKKLIKKSSVLSPNITAPKQDGIYFMLHLKTQIIQNKESGLSINLDEVWIVCRSLSCAILHVKINLNEDLSISSCNSSPLSEQLINDKSNLFFDNTSLKSQDPSVDPDNTSLKSQDPNVDPDNTSLKSQDPSVDPNLFFMSVPADLIGDSVILGVPNLSFASNLTQLTGFYRALPYQEDLKKSAPIISVSSSKGKINGIVQSVSSNWQAGYTASATGSYGGVTVNASFGQNFGGHKMNMKSDTTGITLHAMEDLSNYDLVTGYGADFYLWEYPAYRNIIDTKPVDFVTILVPIGYSEQYLDAKQDSLGYFPDYEIGSLLTYIGSDIPGYAESELLFTPSTLTVTADSQGGMTLVYDKNSSTSKEDTRSSETSVNASLGIHFFGVANLTAHYTQSKVDNKSIHTAQNTDYSVTFHSGTVSDSQYEYKITPLIYRHKDSKILITTCRVELEGLGSGWKDYFSAYDVRLMRMFPDTKNKTLQAFSRSIRFKEHSDGTVDISLYIFNNSLYPAQNIKCDIYLGQANFNVNPVNVSKLKHLGVLPVDSLDVVERKTITLKNQNIPKKSFITVKIEVNDLVKFTKYFWGAYPYNYADHLIDSILNDKGKNE